MSRIPKARRDPVTVEDLALCRWDLVRFSRILGIEPHPGQVRIYEAIIARDAGGQRSRWLTTVISAGNRAGKTLIVTVVALHHTLFKIGAALPRAPDEDALDRFNRLPYDWYHFGIQQEIGELVWHAGTQILEGSHPAQKNGCPLTESLGPVAAYDTKERGEYRQIRWDPLFGGGHIHFRTTAERGVGSLGKDMNGISFDECGFEPNLEFVVDEVLDMRRLSTGGPLLLISTPSMGFNAFADVWKRGDPDDPQREPKYASFRLSARENVGYGLDKGIFERLVAGYPEHLRPQNVDGYFIQGVKAFFDAKAVDAMFVDTIPEVQAARARHRYVQGVDPAAVYDATWSITLDATEPGRATGVRAVRRTGKQKVTEVAGLVRQVHRTYSVRGATCETAVDTTGMGGKVFVQLLEGIHPIRHVEFGGTKKQKMRLLTDLKGLIEQGRLRFPREGVWLVLRRQLLAYILDDRRIEQDAVMALAVATKQIMRQMAGTNSAPFDFWRTLEETRRVDSGHEIQAPLDTADPDTSDPAVAEAVEQERNAYRLRRAGVFPQTVR